MSSTALLKLRELLINRRREIFEQVAHLEPVNGHTMINSISAACIFAGVEANFPAE